MRLNRTVFAVLSICLHISGVGCSKIETEPLTQDGTVVPSGTPSNTNGNSGPVSQRLTMTGQNDKVDLLLIIDNSGSMRDDSTELADKMEGFITQLLHLNLDWQMCLTTTQIADGKAQIRAWSGVTGQTPHILSHSETNLRTKILNTIDDMQFGGGTTGDERGIAALSLHFDKRVQTGCYREGAAFSAILISDEDERSVGGDPNIISNQYKPLEDIDRPDSYLQKISGKILRMTFNSLIVKPGDQACYDLQKEQTDSRAYYGKIYKELSEKTQGVVGSICSPNYSAELGQFAQAIEQSLTRIRLNCIPVTGSMRVTVTPRSTEQWQIQGQDLVISNLGPNSTTWDLQYICP